MGAIKKKQGDCPNSPYKHLATTTVPLFQPKWLVVLALREQGRKRRDRLKGGSHFFLFFFHQSEIEVLWRKNRIEKKGGSRRRRRGLKLRELLRAPRCARGGWPGKVKVVPHQSLPYAAREMDPAGHFIFLFLISSFERWRRERGREGDGWRRSLKMDGPGVTQEQRGFNVKIKACYLRLQGSFFFLFFLSVYPSLTFPPHAPSFLFRGWCQGAIERRQCVLNSDQRRERGKLF